MMALALVRQERIVWAGLGSDVLGLCDGCHRHKPLYVQHVPTDNWYCKTCFTIEIEEQEAR